MKKSVLTIILVTMFLFTGSAFAAPLTGYKAGDVAVDLNFRSAKNSVSSAEFPNIRLNETIEFGRKLNFEPSVTVGIADRWAIQYRNVNAKSKTVYVFDDGDGVNVYADNKLNVNEFNVLYSVTSNISAFAGYVRTKSTVNFTDDINSLSDTMSGSKNTWQIGLLGVVPIVDRLSLYGVLGVGSKWQNYEIGLSYAFTKNVAFNLDYRYMKAGKFDGRQGSFFNFEGFKSNSKSRGLGFGVTFKF